MLSELDKIISPGIVVHKSLDSAKRGKFYFIKYYKLFEMDARVRRTIKGHQQEAAARQESFSQTDHHQVGPTNPQASPQTGVY